MSDESNEWRDEEAVIESHERTIAEQAAEIERLRESNAAFMEASDIACRDATRAEQERDATKAELARLRALCGEADRP